MYETESAQDALQKLAELKDPREYSLSKLVDEAVELKIDLTAGKILKGHLGDDDKKILEGIEARLGIVYTELDRREKIYRGTCVLPDGRIEGGKYW